MHAAEHNTLTHGIRSSPVVRTVCERSHVKPDTYAPALKLLMRTGPSISDRRQDRSLEHFIREGFCSLDIADHLEGLSGIELASLLSGEQYLDVDSLVATIQSAAGQNGVQMKNWLERFIRSLSEHSIRIFLARATNKLSLPQPGMHITFEVGSQSSTPVFMPAASHMQLPECSTYEAFASRMGIALRWESTCWAQSLRTSNG